MARHQAYSLLLGIWILFCASFSRAGEDVWTEVQSPHFIVISNASPKQARRTAKSFEQFRLIIRNALPLLDVDPGNPLTVFAAKDERTYKSLVGEDQKKRNEVKTSGLFMGGPERRIVAVRLDLPEDQAYHVIYHEYVHMLIRLNLGEIPIWLNEGLAEFFGYATIADRESFIGNPSPEHISTLRTQSFIPLPVLLLAGQDSPYYRQQDKAAVFYAQSWALTHYLMIGEKQKHIKKMSDYMSLIRKGISANDAAVQAFGDLKALEQSIRNYVQLDAYYHVPVPIKLDITEEQYAALALSSAESMASRGEVLVYVDQPDRAKAMLESALQLDPGSARANEAMGFLFLKLNDRANAQKYLSKASDLDSTSCLAHFFAAQNILTQGDDRDFAIVEKRLRKAISLNPRFGPAYRQLSYVMQRQMKLPEALEAGQRAALLEPGELSHKLNVADILVALGKMDEANAMGREIFTSARTVFDRDRAESLLSRIKEIQKDKEDFERYKEESVRNGKARTRELTGRPKQDGETVLEDGQYRAYEKAEEQRKARINYYASFKTGPITKRPGTVSKVECSFPAIIDVVHEAGGKQYLFFAENYYQVQFMIIGGSKETVFDPCKDLEGRRAEIEFVSVDSKELSGFIKTITIMK